MIRDLDPVEVAKAQAEVLGQVAASEPRLANLDAATTAHDEREFTLVLQYRRRRFRVPPIPARQGLTLLVLDRHMAWCWRELKRLHDAGRNPSTDPETTAVIRELVAALEHTYAVMWECVRPMGWWDRLTWRRQRNPFLHSSEGEVQELLDFFSHARRTSRVFGKRTLRAHGFRPTTSGPPWPDLPLASRAGWHQQVPRTRATPAAGATTNSGPHG